MRNYLSTIFQMYRDPKWFTGAVLVTFITAMLSSAEVETRDEEKRRNFHAVRMVISTVWYVVYFRTVIKRMKKNS